MNAFQHHAYFDNDVATNGYDLQVLADTFVITNEPVLPEI